MTAGLRIALSGYYGCGNTGDEAVLAGIVESFARRAGSSDIAFTVLSADPADTGRRHGLQAVDRMRLSALRQTMRGSDLLLSGGGSLLQDTTSLRSLFYYLWVARMARSCGTPVMFYAQGIGPLRRRIARWMTRLVADRVQSITVRDPASADLLRRIGVRRPPIEVTADPAFALTPEPPERAREILKAAGAPEGRPLLGLALRPWRTLELTVEQYAAMARRLAETTDAGLLFLPMQPPGDLDLAERVAAKLPGPACVLREPLSPREMLAVIGEMTGLAAMRLHALIFGALGGVPLLALSYDPKVAGLMTSLGQAARVVDLADFTAEAAAARMADALAEGEALRSRLRERARIQAERALVNVDRALETARPR